MPLIIPEKMLPDESEMGREDMLEAFVAVVNICEPEHPYKDDPYPIDKDEVSFSYCKSYWAKCGPRGTIFNTASYSVNVDYVNGCTTEEHLALLTHEVSHITEGRHSGSLSHPKAFWREMAFNCWQMRDNWRDVRSVFGSVDKDEYIEEVIIDPNSSTVDRRIETVEECRTEMAELLGREYDGT